MDNNLKTDYLDLVEEHRDVKSPINLFEKILVVCSRAKDLQQEFSLNTNDKGNPCYQALREYKNGKLHFTVALKDANLATNEEDEEEEV